MKGQIRFLAALILAATSLQATAFGQIHYEIRANDSRVQYDMEHTLHKWSAVSSAATGSVTVDQDLNGGHVFVSIPVTTFDSQNSNRDSHMAEVVESYIYPDVQFISDRIVAGHFQHERSEARGQWQIEGTLTFHGVSKKITMPVDIDLAGHTLKATGSVELKLTDYNIELPQLLLVPVKDWIRISFTISGQTTSTPPL